MVQQGRVLAAALASQGSIDAAQAVLTDLRQRQQARLRVVDASGRLVADSSRLARAPIRSPIAPRRAQPERRDLLRFALSCSKG